MAVTAYLRSLRQTSDCWGALAPIITDFQDCTSCDLWQAESTGTVQKVVWVQLLLSLRSSTGLDLQAKQDEEGEGEEEHGKL